MSLKTFVKVSNISSLSDARYCAGMGVDILGFNIDPRCDTKIKPKDYTEIAEWVAGVQFAGEFNESNLEDIKNAMKDYHTDFIEVTNIELIEPIGSLSKPIIYKTTINSDEELIDLKSSLSYLDDLVQIVVIKSLKSELFPLINQEIQCYNGKLRLLKGYHTSATDEDLQKFPGLELEATKEERPGFQEYGEIMDMLEAIEED